MSNNFNKYSYLNPLLQKLLFSHWVSVIPDFHIQIFWQLEVVDSYTGRPAHHRMYRITQWRLSQQCVSLPCTVLNTGPLFPLGEKTIVHVVWTWSLSLYQRFWIVLEII